MFDRWRNSHGFGVHSPFGYQLVERVVRPCRGYAYYAYDDIDRACSSSEHRIADKAKMLLRLVCFLRPRTGGSIRANLNFVLNRIMIQSIATKS